MNQLEYICTELNNDECTSKAIAILIEPHKDFLIKKQFPSFISCQFLIRENNNKKYLDVIANYRKQEMRYWWALNIAELYKMLNDVKKNLSEEVKIGKITTVSNVMIFAEEKAFGRSYVSSIDYHMDIDPAYVMHQAHSIMCNKSEKITIDELEKTDFIKLMDEIFNDFAEFVKARNNKDGNSKPRTGIIELVKFIEKAKNDSCAIQNNFYKSLKSLSLASKNFSSSSKDFEDNLKVFDGELKETKQSYEELKNKLVINE